MIFLDNQSLEEKHLLDSLNCDLCFDTLKLYILSSNVNALKFNLYLKESEEFNFIDLRDN